MTEGTDMNQIEKVARAICAADPEIRRGDAEHIVQQLVNTEWRNYTDAAKAAIAAMQPAPQWYGIETAPRDWTDVLVFSPKHSGFNCGGVLSAFYDTAHPGWFVHGPGDNIPLTPTHWMPLPAPPAGGSDAE